MWFREEERDSMVEKRGERKRESGIEIGEEREWLRKDGSEVER